MKLFFIFIGKGFSKDDVAFFYNRMGNADEILMKGIRYGVGYHHAGLNHPSRMTVESLLRKRFLNVVVATSTLALGIHVPCKTVVIAGDDIFLTPLLYRQMSGRAGRRGFDNLGNVIFHGVPEKKIKRLMSANLSRITGNFPISVTLCLRLLTVVKEVREKGKPSKRAQKDTITRFEL